MTSQRENSKLQREEEEGVRLGMQMEGRGACLEGGKVGRLWH